MNDIIKNYRQQKFLMHAGERKNHKYIARASSKSTGKWRYFYDQEPYRRFVEKNRSYLDESIEETYDENGQLEKV